MNGWVIRDGIPGYSDGDMAAAAAAAGHYPTFVVQTDGSSSRFSLSNRVQSTFLCWPMRSARHRP